MPDEINNADLILVREKLRTQYIEECQDIIQRLKDTDNVEYHDIAESGERLRTLVLLLNFLPNPQPTEVALVERRTITIQNILDSINNNDLAAARGYFNHIFGLSPRRAEEAINLLATHLQTKYNEAVELLNSLRHDLVDSDPAKFKAILHTLFGLTPIETAQIFERFSTQ